MDIDALKARANNSYVGTQQEGAKEEFQSSLQKVPPIIEPLQQRKLPEALRSQLGSLEREMAELNAPVQKIDLGPLPEEAQKKVAGVEDAGVKKVTPQEQLLKEKTEKACAPMDFGELIMTGRVQQDVPVLPGKLRVTFQSLTGAESYWIERTVVDQPAEIARSWAIYMQLAMSIHAVNGSVREPFNVNDKIERGVLERRLALLLKMNTRMIELLIANMFWFFDRVTALYENDFESIKNG